MLTVSGTYGRNGGGNNSVPELDVFAGDVYYFLAVSFNDMRDTEICLVSRFKKA